MMIWVRVFESKAETLPYILSDLRWECKCARLLLWVETLFDVRDERREGEAC